MKGTIICDLDGTLAFDDHRRPLIPTKGWAAYFAACKDDVLNESVARFIGVWNGASAFHSVVILTGRCESVRAETEEWLQAHGVAFAHLLMRPADSYDPNGTSATGGGGHWVSDEQVKLNMVQQLGLNPNNVLCCLDDRDHMVKFWRSMGFDCWQVRPEGVLY